jgi:hypothetical protein
VEQKMFSLIRLGTQAFFDEKTRDKIEEKDYIIKPWGTTEHLIITSKLTGKSHIIPIYNVSYIELKSQNDSVKESPHEDATGKREDSRANELSNGPSVKEKSKKPKKN